jgi:hypothetical protein
VPSRFDHPQGAGRLEQFPCPPRHFGYEKPGAASDVYHDVTFLDILSDDFPRILK